MPERRPENRRRPRLRAALALSCFLAAAPASGEEVGEFPPPPPGEVAITVLALLDYQRNLCDTVAGKALGHWRRLGEEPRAVEQVRDYLVNEELSELAANRAAGDLSRSLVPEVRSEAGAVISGTLERLADRVRDLCDAVSWPTGTRQEFAAVVSDALDAIDREEEELGSLVVVSEEDLRTALEPYLMPIQLAGIDASSEYLDYLDSLRPKPEAPTLEELMQVWHRRYSVAARPTKVALGKYLQARSDNDNRAMAAACKEILTAVIPLLRDEEIWKLPTPRVPASRGMTTRRYPPLHEAYHEIRELAVSCTSGRSREVLEHFDKMQSKLQIAAAHLAQFSLAP